MIVDAGTGERAAFRGSFDVCVVGTGPAGMTLARKLAGNGLRVALMEGGGRHFTPESQNLYTGEIVGLDYFPLDVTRLRYLGGSSNHWAGWCREIPEIDFAPRQDDPWSGWPIAKSDLDPHQPEADQILELPPSDAFGYAPVEHAEAVFRRFQMRRSAPVLFSEKYAGFVEASDAIVLGLNANLVDLRIDEATGAVMEAIFRGYGADDPGFSVQARAYALCLGGIENPRALLNANNQRVEGLGNEHDLVGRFFSEHPHYDVGEVLLEQPFEQELMVAPTTRFMDQQGVLNFALVLEAAEPLEELSFLKTAIRSVPCATEFTERLAERVLGRYLYCREKGFAAYWAQDDRVQPDAILRIISEQALNFNSRVALSEDRDAFGLRRPALDWRLMEADYSTMREATIAFGAYLAEAGIGRIRVADWLLADQPEVPPYPAAETGGHHHLCTTRMAADSSRGVVDANCQVHSVPNLYLGGSSVFATGSWVNPTYTIVQLALRLGDHLAIKLGSPHRVP